MTEAFAFRSKLVARAVRDTLLRSQLDVAAASGRDYGFALASKAYSAAVIKVMLQTFPSAKDRMSKFFDCGCLLSLY